MCSLVSNGDGVCGVKTAVAEFPTVFGGKNAKWSKKEMDWNVSGGYTGT